MITAVKVADRELVDRQTLVGRWTERHDVDTPRQLAEAENLADAVEITSDNTIDSYDKSRCQSRMER